MTKTAMRSCERLDPVAFGQSLIADKVAAVLRQPPPRQSYTIHPGETIMNQYQVNGGPSVSFSTQWPGSDVVMSLRSPSGRVFDRTTQAAGVRHLVGPMYETYMVDNPEPGTWTVTLFGRQVSANGEETRLLVSETPTPNQPPQAKFATTLDRRTVTVDAGASSDADGTIVEYLWDFGDEATATGSRVSHTYTRPGTYRITLAIKDNGWAEAFASADQAITISRYDFTGFFSPVAPATRSIPPSPGRPYR